MQDIFRGLIFVFFLHLESDMYGHYIIHKYFPYKFFS